MPRQATSTVTGAVESEIFRDVIGRFASGVTVITTSRDGHDAGTTASAFSSLSLDPPMLLVCLNKASGTQAAVRDAGIFAVNILGEDQGEVAYRFARKGDDKFAGVAVDRGEGGVPLLRDALAHLECRVKETVTGGTHAVFLAEVVRATGKEGSPLAYFRGRFGRLEGDLEEAVYRELRGRVVTRSLPVGEAIDVDALANELATDVSRVYYALTKLAGDGLVTRRDGSTYVVKPLSVKAAAEIFDARSAVETAVVEQTVGRIPAAKLDELEALATALRDVVEGEEPDLDSFLRASHAFHVRLVGLAGCPPLNELYDRLGIPAFWHRLLGSEQWWRLFDIHHHTALVEALRHQDSDRAKQLIHEHRDQVKRLARLTIDAAGGQV